MNSTKRYLPVLAGVCALFLTATLNAQNATQGFDSDLMLLNPCNQSAVHVKGPTSITYHENGDAPHVVLHMQINADGQDETGSPYSGSFEANGQFDTAASSYFVPFHSVWIGQGGATNFKFDGIVLVWVTNGTPSGSQIMKSGSSITCTN